MSMEHHLRQMSKGKVSVLLNLQAKHIEKGRSPKSMERYNYSLSDASQTTVRQSRLAIGSVCVTWALGRKGHLSYYDQLRSRLITPPLSLLLTRIKGFYESQLSLLPPTSHSFLLSDKVMAVSFDAV
jgi:hypothetical protein